MNYYRAHPMPRSHYGSSPKEPPKASCTEMPCTKRPHPPAPPRKRERSLAMAYVPWQEYTNLYGVDCALANGTLFADLNMPFEGKRGCNG